jgi:hypothetical protein
MFIKETNGKFIFSDSKKSLKYKKYFNKEINKIDEKGNKYTETVQELKYVVVFNPQLEHFLEAGYKELIQTEVPNAEINQYIETTYELKNNKYYEVHKVVDMPEVMLNE